MARYCRAPSCGVLVARGYCATHRRTFTRTPQQKGYTKRWDQAATRFRARYPLCGQRIDDQPPVLSRCHDRGRVTLATDVDHVVPHHGDTALFWDARNWQSLCASCHARKTFRGL